MPSRELIDQLARTPQSHVFLLALGLTVVRLGLFPLLWRTKRHLRSGGYKIGRFFNEAFDSIVYAGILIFFVVRPFAFQTFTIPSGSMVPTLLVNDFIGINKAIYRYTEPQRFDIVVFRPPKRAANPDQIDEAGNINVDFVKRLIGLPGDLIEIREGVLYVNGQRSDQPWVHLMKNIPGSRDLYDDLPSDEVAALPKASFKLVERNGEVMPLNWTQYDVNSPQPVSNGLISQPYNVASDFQVISSEDGESLKRLPAVKVPPGHYLFMGDNRLNSADGRNWGLAEREAIVGRAEFIWLPFPRIQGLRGK